MLVGTDAVLDYIKVAQPSIIWLQNGSLSTSNPIVIAYIEEDNADIALEKLTAQVNILGPSAYSIRYTKMPGQEAGEKGKFLKQHSNGLNFTIPRASQNQQQQNSFSQYPMQGVPAVGNPYGGTTYSKAELDERIEAAVKNARLELKLEHLQNDFSRQLKEAKEDKGDTVNQLISGIIPMLPQMLGKQSVAMAGPPPAAQYNPPGDAPTAEATESTEATPEQAEMVEHAIARLLALCNGDVDLMVLRLNKLCKLAENPGMLMMLDSQNL